MRLLFRCHARARADPLPFATRQPGTHAGIWSWALPDTPGGTSTVPKQAWSGAGSGKDGEIYVGGMDQSPTLPSTAWARPAVT